MCWRIVLHVKELNVSSSSEAAVVADKFVLTHKSVFSSPCGEITPSSSVQNAVEVNKPSPFLSETRECFYCDKVVHLMAVYPALERKCKKSQTAIRIVGIIKTMNLEIN